uniref:Uncharacterized protein n=1 Tax=Panagrolaimus sp. ES5 TaxID=591445 RepID=A0AC34GPL3_9BILA
MSEDALFSDDDVAAASGQKNGCDDDPEKYKWAFYAFIALFAYSAALLLCMTIFLIIYRQYVRFIFLKKPVSIKPGMTLDETMTTMGTTRTQTEASVKSAPSKRDKHDKDDERTPPKSKSKKKKKK